MREGGVNERLLGRLENISNKQTNKANECQQFPLTFYLSFGGDLDLEPTFPHTCSSQPQSPWWFSVI